MASLIGYEDSHQKRHMLGRKQRDCEQHLLFECQFVACNRAEYAHLFMPECTMLVLLTSTYLQPPPPCALRVTLLCVAEQACLRAESSICASHC